eukprot:PhF_6_TR10012/c1_g1_i4/m.15300
MISLDRFLCTMVMFSTFLSTSAGNRRDPLHTSYEYQLPRTPFSFDVFQSLNLSYSEIVVDIKCDNCTLTTQNIVSMTDVNVSLTNVSVSVPGVGLTAVITTTIKVLSPKHDPENTDMQVGDTITIYASGVQSKEYNITFPKSSWRYLSANSTHNMTCWEIPNVLGEVPFNGSFASYPLLGGMAFELLGNASDVNDSVYIQEEWMDGTFGFLDGTVHRNGWMHPPNDVRVGIGIRSPKAVGIRRCVPTTTTSVSSSSSSKSLLRWRYEFPMSGELFVPSTGSYIKFPWVMVNASYDDAVTQPSLCRLRSNFIRRSLGTILNDDERLVLQGLGADTWICARGYGTVESFRWECGRNQGQPLFYSRWAPGEPRLLNGCVYLNMTDHLFWTDDCVQGYHNVYCKIEIAPPYDSTPYYGYVIIEAPPATSPGYIPTTEVSWRASKSVQIASAVSQYTALVSVSVAAFVTGGSVLASSGRTAMNVFVAELYQCTESEDSVSDYAGNPLRIQIEGILGDVDGKLLGSLVGNTILSIVNLAFVLLARGMTQRPIFDGLPGNAIICFLYFYGFQVMTAVRLADNTLRVQAIEEENDSYIASRLVCAIINTIHVGYALILFRVYWVNSRDVVKQHAFREVRYRQIFGLYTSGVEWFVCVDSICQLLLAAVTGYTPRTSSECTSRRMIALGVFCGHLAVMLWRRPITVVFELVLFCASDAMNIITILYALLLTYSDGLDMVVGEVIIAINSGLLTTYALTQILIRTCRRVGRLRREGAVSRQNVVGKGDDHGESIIAEKTMEFEVELTSDPRQAKDDVGL